MAVTQVIQPPSQGFHPFNVYPGSGGSVGLRTTFPKVGELLGTTQRQVEGESPFLGGHPATIFNNMSLTPEVISLTPGLKQLSPTLIQPHFLTSWANSGATPSLLWLDNDGVLKRLLLSGSTITTVGTPAQTFAGQCRSVYFRNHILANTNGSGLMWYSGVTDAFRKVGVTPPLSAPTGLNLTSGVLTGGYHLLYTYINDRGHESNPSPLSGLVTVTSATIQWNAITPGPAGTVSRRLYRTTSDGATYLLLTTLANNTTTSYNDNTPDTGLGHEASADNNPPPDNIADIAVGPSRVALLSQDGLTVLFSRIDPELGEPNWEAYPVSLSLTVPFAGGKDRAKAVAFIEGFFYIFGHLNTYRLLGDIAINPKIELVFPGLGLHSPATITQIPGGVIILTADKRLVKITSAGFTNIGDSISEILRRTVPPQGASMDATVTYLPTQGQVLINLALANYSDTLTSLVLDLATGQFTTNDYRFGATHYCAFNNGLYGVGWNSHILSGWFTDIDIFQLDYKQLGAYPAAKIEYFPYTPLPGFDIDFGWIEIMLEAKPIVSNVVPTLKVSFAMDGSGTYVSKHVDFSRDYIIKDTPTGAVVRSVRVPVHRTGRSITLRVEPAQNAASMGNGVEIYGLTYWARPVRETRDSRNNREWA